MRTLLLIFIGVCNLLLVGRSIISYSACRTEQADIKSDLTYWQSTREPYTDGFITMHSDRLARLARHWKEARSLAIASGIGSIICLGLSMKKRGNNVG